MRIVLLLAVSVFLIIAGLIEVKSRYTDAVLKFAGALTIVGGIAILICIPFAWEALLQ